MKHTEQCIKAQEEYKRSSEEFIQNHPNHCVHCGGWGVVGSGQTDTDTGIVDVDICPYCLDEEKCPYCGSHIDDPFDKCESCGWDMQTSSGKPSEPECWCYDLTDRVMDVFDTITEFFKEMNDEPNG